MDTNILSSRAVECGREEINGRCYRVFRECARGFEGEEIIEYLALSADIDGGVGCTLHSKTVAPGEDARRVAWERWPEVIEC